MSDPAARRRPRLAVTFWTKVVEEDAQVPEDVLGPEALAERFLVAFGECLLEARPVSSPERLVAITLEQWRKRQIASSEQAAARSEDGAWCRSVLDDPAEDATLLRIEVKFAGGRGPW